MQAAQAAIRCFKHQAAPVISCQLLPVYHPAGPDSFLLLGRWHTCSLGPLFIFFNLSPSTLSFSIQSFPLSPPSLLFPSPFAHLFLYANHPSPRCAHPLISPFLSHTLTISPDPISTVFSWSFPSGYTSLFILFAPLRLRLWLCSNRDCSQKKKENVSL